MLKPCSSALHGPGRPARPDQAGPGCKISKNNWAGPSSYRAGQVHIRPVLK